MKAKILYVWSSLQSSFWFVPLQLILLSIIAATGFVYLDNVLDFQPSGIYRYFLIGSVDSARSILSTIAGAMIGVAGTVFSITLVALTLASSQFGPRLLQNFMHDRINQIVLGSYIATFTYCLLVLSSVKSTTEFLFLPRISVTFAMFLAIVNIFLLVIFIHHISVNIQADQVISKVNDILNSNFSKLFPMEKEEESPSISDEQISALIEKAKFKKVVAIKESGYLQTVSRRRLISLARDVNGFIELKKRAGNYLVDGQDVFEVYSEKEIDEDFEENIRSALILGRKRTSSQDAEFAIRQMVEVAARALSPGVNDPYTAITCIDMLTDSICYLTRIELPTGQWFDEEGKLRLITKMISFDGVVGVAFNQIRQYGQNSPAVMIRLMDAMVTIFTLAKKKR